MTIPPNADSTSGDSSPTKRTAAESGFEIGTDGVSAVVVGFDGTDPSRDALAFAAGIARRGGGHLIVVYVIRPIGMTGLSPAAGALSLATAREDGEVLRAEIEPELRQFGVSADFVVREGDIAREIEAVADSEHADLIVVGRSSSRTHAVMGSVALALVRHAQRPVSVVP
jgi:nucleotide-binding universal stress UspA family protein